MPSPLADLDELTLKCRDEKSKQYIREAVSCYKSGAFRASIVSTWIAVVFDLIDKFKELASLGDKEAELQINDIEKARKNNDVKRFLDLERQIITVARDKLELLSHTESLDLERLQEDRNRCAHPSMNVDGDIFNPSAELARLHINSAVIHLLQHPPAQGKYSLDRLIKEVESKYFPTTVPESIVILRNTPLLKPKFSLLRNFIIVTIKNSLNNKKGFIEKQRYYLVLNALQEMHRELYNQIATIELSKLFSALDDEDMVLALDFLSYTNDSWILLDQAAQLKICKFVHNLPSDHFDRLEFLVSKNFLKKEVNHRISRATEAEIHVIIPFDMHPAFIDRLIRLYELSDSFASANSWVNNNHSYISEFSDLQIKKIISSIADNPQISESFEVNRLLRGLISNKKITKDELNILLKESELDNLVIA